MILGAEPDGQKTAIRYPGETLSFRLTVQVPVSLKTEESGESVIEADVVTNMVDSTNEKGEWVIKPMTAEAQPPVVGSRTWKRPESEEVAPIVNIVFFVMLYPTTLGKYYFKYRVRARNAANANGEYQWFGGSEEMEYKMRIRPTDPESKTWIAGPTAIEVHPNIYVGNFMAACIAPTYGFTAILNVAEELDVPLEKFPLPNPFYKKIGLVDGTVNPITLEHILACVRWVEMRENGKVLIHCRAGCGRSGSIAIAYKCKKFPLLSYDDVLSIVWKAKSDITPHKNLKQTIESIKWD